MCCAEVNDDRWVETPNREQRSPIPVPHVFFRPEDHAARDGAELLALATQQAKHVFEAFAVPLVWRAAE